MSEAMPVWPVQKTKARFSELLEVCVAEGPQLVTKRGRETAVLVPIDEWRRLQRDSRPSLKQLLFSDQARFDDLVPERGSARRSAVEPIV
ncbi:type II toxin-antitoxin system Phd/YefM family antitoxin [Tessaracoccus sp.]|uniref:type II toxin-antitoxin system Phd/YefM family antitoxin n=1 Tax=Tessaracoccus sp. TaxID=1971211 RepID=UPI00260BCAA8|nr:type II toxin-antitoxin system Phd/YefM family antitoxin [Tessaracoccus sp.]